VALELHAQKAGCAAGNLPSSMSNLTHVTASMAAASNVEFEFPPHVASDSADAVKQINERIADLAKNVPHQSPVALKTSTQIMVSIYPDISPCCLLTRNTGGGQALARSLR